MVVDSILKEFLAEPGSGRQSVIVEVARPPVAPPDRYTTRGERPSGTGSSHGVLVEALNRVEKALASLDLAAPPTRLESTGTLVVEVTSDQLRRILKLPGVAAVHANRKRRAPRPKSTDAF